MTRVFAWLSLATLMIMAPRDARAGDPLKPYVVLILDTSGSMDSSTGSGPPSCGGPDTRINHAKCAINRIVNSYGDMVFALGRFRETTAGTVGAGQSCDANGDHDGNPNNSIPVPGGGDQCSTQGPYCGGTQTSPGCTCNNSTQCGAGGSCVNGVCNNSTQCTTADKEFQLLTALVDGNNQLAGNWTDNVCGVCSAPTPGTDPTAANEIWAVSPNTFTPLAAVLNGAKTYWKGTELASDGTTVIWPSTAAGFAPIANDPTSTSFLPSGCNPAPNCTTNCCASQCRPYVTILLTDGAETCTTFTNTTSAASSLLQTDVSNRRYRVTTKPIGFGISPGNAQIEGIAHAGGAADVPNVNEGFYAANEAELQLAISAILKDAIKTESCNALDDDCDNAVDEDFPNKGGACDNGKLGVCRRTGNLVCRADGTGLQCNAPAGPNGSPEVCNNLDDDCDGKVDEGLTNCTCIPQAEQCNGLDDDCDNKIDEDVAPRPCNNGLCQGIETCVNGSFNGTCTAPTPQPESCNGLDDNCDGTRDGFVEACSNLNQGFPPFDPRNNPGDPSRNPIPENQCVPGQRTCPANIGPPNQFGACLGEIVPKTEICNGLDDDCDNKIDEDTGGADCSSNCGIGTTVCVNGQLQCDSVPALNDPTCDGVDDDCDTKIDEDWVCDNPPNCECTASGQCNAHQACTNGVLSCIGDPISQESCDCLDNDCDTKIDEGSLCGPGAVCTNCQCAFACSPGEFPCPQGKFCKDNFCIADPCFGVDCPPVNNHAQTCVINAQGNQGTCMDVCSTITCDPLICIPETGECKPDDCTTFPERCQANQVCVVNAQGAGECITNLCLGVTCGSDQYCIDGQCIGGCSTVNCPDGQRCRLGTCQPDPCNVECGRIGKVCNDNTGMCVDNLCSTMQCPQGQYCNPNNNGGTCESDACVTNSIKCPNPGEVCRGGTCAVPEVGDEDVITTGGGGCSAGSTSSVFGALMALFLLIRPRRAPGEVERGDS